MSDGDLYMTVTFSPVVDTVLLRGGKTGQQDKPKSGAHVDKGKTGTVK